MPIGSECKCLMQSYLLDCEALADRRTSSSVHRDRVTGGMSPKSSNPKTLITDSPHKSHNNGRTQSLSESLCSSV
jgi:hypothetical protein